MAKPGGTPVLFVHWGEEGLRGSERVLLDLLARIDRDEFSPLVWCNATTMADAVKALDVPVELSPMPILLGWDAPKLDVAGYRRLVARGSELIRSHGARLVHANSGAPNQWMVPAARRAKLPLVAHLHAVYGLRERCTLLLHQVPVLVGCSAAVVAPLRDDGIPASNLRVIHNGVSLERLERGDARSLRAELGVGEDDVLVAGIGALHRMKGFDVLVRAFGLLAERDARAHLALVGQGPDREALEALARELGVDGRVHFLGQRSDVGAILRDAVDVLAAPSRVESFGLSIVEAGVFGRPAVGTTVGGIPEVIAHEASGLLAPPDQPAPLADALERLIADPVLRRRLGSAARDRLRSEFTVQRVARSFEALYREYAAHPRAAFGWTAQGLRISPFARLGFGVVGRRLGLRTSSA